uniref:C-type lectin domain-containing protein n=1 Tax=Labrus bergylta TaxID=56723 RepID=A0A3Q3FAL6_9LABR
SSNLIRQLTLSVMLTFQIFSLACSPGFCTPILYALREFHYIDLKMNWADAQQYCREKYTDLATIESMADNNRLKGTEHSQAWIGPHRVWIGMYREPWRWSDNRNSSFKNWRDGEPNNYLAVQHCVSLNLDYTWGDDDCTKMHSFWCQTVTRKLKQALMSSIYISHKKWQTKV